MTFNEFSCIKIDDHRYKVMGNSIAGMLRDYLNKTEIKSEEILFYFGGEADDDFISSKMIINDGYISYDKVVELIDIEGTAIDAETATASKNKKYTFKALPQNATLKFLIEFETNQFESEMKRLVRTLTQGFVNQSIQIGGHKSTDFGKLTFNKITQSILVLDSIKKIDEYLLHDTGWESVEFTNDTLDQFNVDYFVEKTTSYYNFHMQGDFPYGVYQNFKVSDSVTGIKEGVIPASSLKGLFRHETEKLIGQLCRNLTSENLINHVKVKSNEIFGSGTQSGIVCFRNMEAPRNKVKINRENFSNPQYIKIDRLTGGVINKATFATEEYYGSSDLSFLISATPEKLEACVFPMIYCLVQIGKGNLPIGGKTNMGLGIFNADNFTVNNCIFTINEVESNSEVEKYFESFKRWCLDGKY